MSQPGAETSCLSRQQLECYTRGVLEDDCVPAFEEHLGSCIECQSLLTELFESGCRPDWLPIHEASIRTSIDGDRLQHSTLDANDSAALADDVPNASAHQLWQQLASGLPTTALSAMADTPPIMIGRYRIERVLGDGGFGRVYVAYDEKLKRHVAIKVPHLVARKSQVPWDLMLAEAQTVAALDHPSIVPIFDVGTTENIPLYLVGKLIIGQTLADRLATATMSPLEAANILLRVVEALQYAHGRGVIHRDVKPQNILLDNDGQVFLSDFGLAWRDAEDSRMFPSAGTPFYMSPEQLAGDSQQIDQRADIYSVGKVLLEMLGTSDEGVSPTCPPALIAVGQRATAADRQSRYQQTSDLRIDLCDAIAKLTPQRRSRSWSVLLICLACLASAAIAVSTWFRREPRFEPNVAELAHDLPGSVDLLMRCPPDAFESIVQRMQTNLPQIISLLKEQLTDNPSNRELSLLDLERRHAAGIVLLRLGHADDYWQLWRSKSDPRPLTVQLERFGRDVLTSSLFIERLRHSGGMDPVLALPPSFIARLFKAPLTERRNLLLALSTAKGKASDLPFLREVAKLYQLDADACVHGLAAQILSRAGVPLPELPADTNRPTPTRGWYANSLGETMVVVEPSPSVIYRYSIASHELQCRHFQQFLSETGHEWTGKRQQESAAQTSEGCRAQAELNWYDCAAFCNWLSQREGLETCYEPNEEGKFAAGMKIKPDILKLNGYHVPSIAEWETAARGGAFADFCFGKAPFAKGAYLWDASNAFGKPQSVGQLRPNAFGLFDVHGNVSEWTSGVQNEQELQSNVIDQRDFARVGGNAMAVELSQLAYDTIIYAQAKDRTGLVGLRVARAVPGELIEENR